MVPKNNNPIEIGDEELNLQEFYSLVEEEKLDDEDLPLAPLDIALLVKDNEKQEQDESNSPKSHEPEFKAFADGIDNEPPLFKPEPAPVAKKPEKKAPVRVDDLRALLHGEQAPQRSEPENARVAAPRPYVQAPIPQVDNAHIAVSENPAPVVETPRIDTVAASTTSLPELNARLAESFVAGTPVEAKAVAEKPKGSSLANAAKSNTVNSSEPVSQISATPCTFPDCPYVKAMQAELERHGKSGILGKFFSK